MAGHQLPEPAALKYVVFSERKNIERLTRVIPVYSQVNAGWYEELPLVMIFRVTWPFNGSCRNSPRATLPAVTVTIDANRISTLRWVTVVKAFVMCRVALKKAILYSRNYRKRICFFTSRDVVTCLVRLRGFTSCTSRRAEDELLNALRWLELSLIFFSWNL